ncbi:MAG: FCD domain-containing protein [Rhodospirillum sp.]|nr:FCD domain-containing protein [Rhodospirillum sp.]MCF8490210.1 FCD domain-containing protein [Rhodospirillum sp.]MCF8501992.1 FCD domain-containing protein [Rhodospirillum sp.]
MTPPHSPETDRFERISPLPAYQLVAEAIEREIVSGHIPPGEPIGTEADLVKQFGVNRSTVREGIRCLEQSGLIRRESSRRLVASLPRQGKLATRVSRALILHQVTFRELYEAIDMLERSAIELAVAHRTDDDLQAIARNLERTRDALSEPIRLAELDTEFHSLVAVATGNRVLQLAREPASLLIYTATQPIFEHVPEAAPRLLAAHEKLYDALVRRDVEDARAWMRRHVADFGKGFLRTGRTLDDPVDRIPFDSIFQTRGTS